LWLASDDGHDRKWGQVHLSEKSGPFQVHFQRWLLEKFLQRPSLATSAFGRSPQLHTVVHPTKHVCIASVSKR
jgi:hypothetical protein